MKSFLYLFITLSVLAAPLCAQDIESKLSGNTSANGFTVKSNAGTNLFTIRGSGFVGIGTMTPIAPLHIINTTDYNSIRVQATSASSGIYVTQAGTGNAARLDIINATSTNNCLDVTSNAPAPAIYANNTNAAGKIIECTNGTTSRFSVASTGVVLIPERLGIGTATPLATSMAHINNSDGNALRITSTSTASSIWLTQNGAGNAARFDITNATSTNNCLEVTTNAPAPAIYANSTNSTGRIFQANYGTSGTRFFVESSGNVGIGVDDATQDLDVLNNVRVRGVGSLSYFAPLNINSSGILTTATSDRRLKTNIRPLGSTLDNVLQLRGVRYNWKSDPDGAERIGFIAQEVEELIPEVVYTNPVDGYKGLNYAELTAVLTEAVKEQQTLILALKQKVDQVAALQQRVNILESQSSRIRELEADLVSLKALLHENGTLGDRAHASLQSAK